MAEEWVMEHLNEQRLIEELWDGAALTPFEREHLSLCSECQRKRATLSLMHEEFEVAGVSEPSASAESRLFSLFAQITPSKMEGNPLLALLGNLAEWVNALPLWDSRQQAGAVGIRNANRSSYRLLFGAQETEIELMVEPHDGLLRVVGEVMGVQAEGRNAKALVELMTSVDAKSALETESDDTGRFSLEHVPPGRYVMTITPRYSQVVVIEPLELT
jgi:hypothetical protein